MALQLENKQLKCRDCAGDFIFTATEQQFFAHRGLVNEPKRCANCRVSKRLERKGVEVKTSDLICGECGVLTRVPFEPKQGRPVLCMRCLHEGRLQPV